MSTLEDAIATKIADLAQQIAALIAGSIGDVIRGAPVEELLALAGAERRAKPRGRGRVRGSRKAKAPASKRTPKNVDADAILTKLVPMLRAAPEGVSAEAIKKELGLDRNAWRKVCRVGLATKAIRQKGDKRAAVYFAGGKR